MTTKFKLGDRVRKTKGSEWQGKIIGTYSKRAYTGGYCVESEVRKDRCRSILHRRWNWSPSN